MSKEPDHDHEPDNGPGNPEPDTPPDTGRAVARTPTSALSLQELEVALSKVDTSPVIGKSGLPIMSFKREGDGTFSFGRQHYIPAPGSRWGVFIRTFQHGYICFGPGPGNKKLGEKLVPVMEKMPDITTLPNLGFPWQKQLAVDMQCISGDDIGTEVRFAMSTRGGLDAINGLLDTIKARFKSGQHGGLVAPILALEKDWYPHPKHGRVWFPVLLIVDWAPLDGPLPASVANPASPPPVEPQPRRRRVV